jgi:predicted amidohydrolase
VTSQAATHGAADAARRVKLRVATCQFDVAADPRRNGATIRAMIAEAAGLGADLVHFGECALSGYCRANFANWSGYDWAALREETQAVLDACRAHSVWAAFGSSHPLGPGRLPLNCVYVASPEGRLVERYDKRRCSAGDLTCYSPGDHESLVEIKGVRCGVVICMEERFPDLWAQYEASGVELMLHSTSGSLGLSADRPFTEMTPLLGRANAQLFQMFVSQAAWSPPWQEFPSQWVERGGHSTKAPPRHAPGMVIGEIFDDPEADAFAAMIRKFRKERRETVIVEKDPRALDRTAF